MERSTEEEGERGEGGASEKIRNTTEGMEMGGEDLDEGEEAEVEK